jgi:hypothetical protein
MNDDNGKRRIKEKLFCLRVSDPISVLWEKIRTSGRTTSNPDIIVTTRIGTASSGSRNIVVRSGTIRIRIGRDEARVPIFVANVRMKERD